MTDPNTIQVEFNRRAVKKANFITAFKANRGNVSLAAETADINRDTYYEWCKNDTEFAEICHDVIAKTGDYVESQLMLCIDDKELTAIIFYCKTKLKERGYVERQELANPLGQTFKTVFTMGIDSDKANRISEAEALQKTAGSDIPQ